MQQRQQQQSKLLIPSQLTPQAVLKSLTARRHLQHKTGTAAATVVAAAAAVVAVSSCGKTLPVIISGIRLEQQQSQNRSRMRMGQPTQSNIIHSLPTLQREKRLVSSEACRSCLRDAKHVA
jgi:hypothetical protein